MSNALAPGYSLSKNNGRIYGDPRLDGLMIAAGTAVPADTGSGYASGCIFLVIGTSGTNVLYRNEGTLASCAFKKLLSATDVGAIDLTALTATAAELNAAADVSGREVAAGAATLALTVAAHEGRTVLCDQAAGCTFTLPSAAAGIVGARFRIVLSVTATSNSDIVQVANNTDYMVGIVTALTDDATPYARAWETANTGTVATESDTVTLNRTTTGTAKKGHWLEFECIAANVWAVRGAIGQSGAETSPFSAAV